MRRFILAAVAALTFAGAAGATQPKPPQPFVPMEVAGPYRLIHGKCYERNGTTLVHMEYCKTKKQGGWSVHCIDPLTHQHAFCG